MEIQLTLNKSMPIQPLTMPSSKLCPIYLHSSTQYTYYALKNMREEIVPRDCIKYDNSISQT